MFSYNAFGLHLRANLPVPGLLPTSERSESATVTVQLGSLPAGLSADAEPVFSTPGLSLHEGPEHTVFAYADGTRFAIRSDGRAVWATWPGELTLEDTATYLLGPVLAFVLRLHGRLSLHAAAFAAADRAVAVAGGPEAGKSTLLGALALGGARVLSDDVTPLVEEDGAFLVSPTYPRVRLWGDSVAQLLGAPAALPLLTPNWEKRYLDVGARGLFEERALPLAAILALGERASAGAPRVERLSAREACVTVLAHLHSVWMLPRRPQAEIFAIASRLAERVPVFRLVSHRDPARLPELREVVLDAVSGLPEPVAARRGHVSAR